MTIQPSTVEQQTRRARLLPRWFGNMLGSFPGTAGAILLAVFLVMAALAPMIAPHDPTAHDFLSRLKPPAWQAGGDWEHPLGTDQLGRDVASRILHGSRVAIAVGLGGTSIALGLGVLLGLIAGFLGGFLDTLIMRIVDVIISVPNIILYLTILGLFGANLGILIIVIGLVGWTTSARVVRGEVLAIRNREFVEAARVLGQYEWIIMIRHVLPNIVGPIIVVGTLKIASIIILEASLSFLGFGVQPPAITWGQMLSDGRRFITSAWWLATLPGIAITFLSLSLLFLGNWLRDVLDPRTHD